MSLILLCGPYHVDNAGQLKHEKTAFVKGVHFRRVEEVHWPHVNVPVVTGCEARLVQQVEVPAEGYIFLQPQCVADDTDVLGW